MSIVITAMVLIGVYVLCKVENEDHTAKAIVLVIVAMIGVFLCAVIDMENNKEERINELDLIVKDNPHLIQLITVAKMDNSVSEKEFIYIKSLIKE